MTETLNRPARPVPRPPRRAAEAAPPRHPLAVGSAAALWAAAGGLLLVLLPVLLVEWADSRSGAGTVEALRTGGRLWLLAHGVSLGIPGGDVGLTPLGLVLLPLALLVRFAAAAARDSRPPTVGAAGSLAVVVAGPYALLVALAAVLASAGEVHVSPVQALVAGAVLGVVGGFAGALRPNRLWRAAWHTLSRPLQRVLLGAATALGVLVGAGSLLVGGSLAVHLPRAADLATAGEPGPVGGAALLVLGLLLVPNAVVWGLAWLAGPGFAVGTGTAVSPFAHELGSVPAVPLLAALPAGGVPTAVGVLVLLVPLGAGVLAGRVAAPVSSSRRAAALAVAPVGAMTGAVVAGLCWLSGGPVGGDRLVDVGPSPSGVGLAVALAVTLGAVAAAAARRPSPVAAPDRA